MKTLSQQELDELQATKPSVDIEAIQVEDIDLYIVVRYPSRLEWKKYRGEIAAAASSYDVQWQMIVGLLVYPTAQEFDAYLEKHPAAVQTAMAEIAEMAGISNKAVRKKPSRA